MSEVRWSATLDRIQEDVQTVEEYLRSACESRVTLVGQVNRHTLEAGGKRLRPGLVLVAAKATGRTFDHSRAVALAGCLELIHMATLVHDDVIDNAGLRRGRPTASSIFGNTGAILAGDVLLAQSMCILAEDGDLPIIRAVSRSVKEMAEGEAREVETRSDYNLSREDHFEILRMKTATFVECCCRVGAMVSGAPDADVNAYADYGHHLGMAFQIIDDLLDYRLPEDTTGKQQATDFREGCATLPLILLRNELTDEEAEFASNRFGAHATEDEIRMICGWMETRGCYERVQRTARDHVDQAIHALRRTPAGEHRDLLESVTEFVLRREK